MESLIKEDLFDTIFILRHGQRADTVYNPEIEYKNKQDPPMTRLGEEQCIATAKYLRDFIMNLNKF